MSEQTLTILAIDPASITGWALLLNGEITSGTIDVRRIRKNQGPGHQMLLIERELDERFGELPDGSARVVIERPGYFKHIEASVIVGGLSMHAKLWAKRHGHFTGHYSPQTVKKHATGHGHSGKEQMIAHARHRWPDVTFFDDNQADAMWLLDLAINGVQ